MAGKVTKAPTSANTEAVVGELTAQGKVTEVGTPQAPQEALAPGLVRFLRNHKFPIGKVLNPDTPFEKLPDHKEVIDPETGKPKKGMRFRTIRGNVMVKF